MFSEHFVFSLPARINFVGGGGKTALIFRLLAEFAESMPAVYTTTTRIHAPHPTEGMIVLAADREHHLALLLERAAAVWGPGRSFVATHLPVLRDLLGGVDPAFAGHLDRTLVPMVLNEADGARSMSLKMPRAGEPVLMEGAEYLVPVIGLDCLDKPLGPQSVFRWELAEEKYGMKAGRKLTARLATSILFHKEGVCKDWQPGITIIPYINKADTPAEDASARALARALISNGNFPVERVVYGSVENSRVDHLDA